MITLRGPLRSLYCSFHRRENSSDMARLSQRVPVGKDSHYAATSLGLANLYNLLSQYPSNNGTHWTQLTKAEPADHTWLSMCIS